ncbi:MAG: nucleotidyl transferase AbiEii/AbiGii toxin family protein [Burkholderiales bacterium]|nr:nucleotidyl transferase AbiEii/AbiGii toxin family protein [Burkholderiales bacterium]MBK8665520.1 nucleotidyl transferase AbiEii/AbiGii toxin family protein [Burkholderiales bacterium]
MNEIDIEAWVEAAPDGQRGFREAVHIVLDSIGHSQNLRTRMVMKGGLLLAIRYESTRFTRDLDFSTSERYIAADAEKLLAEFEAGLAIAEDRLPYETACRLQSRKVEPKGENRTHHNLALTIGFADKSHPGAMARLTSKNSAQVVHIDYSFNEAVFDVELLELDGGTTIRSYSLHNVLAEKMRSLLQQPIRKRNRRQDVYDIWLLLESVPPFPAAELALIHEMLVMSCRSKGIEPTVDSMDDEAVVKMAREGYADLQADVDGDLPSFEDAMIRVTAFYDSLPWNG